MHIGLDFDNTIVSYDEVFHKVALERELIRPTVKVSKLAVRDHLRAKGLEEIWIEMQGYVYGPRMKDAVIYPGFLDFLDWALAQGHTVSIVSHKTLKPFSGPEYDLHKSARNWIETHLVQDGRRLIDPERVSFEVTKKDKIARIAAIGCDVFIDDLPEILLAEGMPARIRKILFDPDAHHADDSGPAILRARGWSEMRHFLDG